MADTYYGKSPGYEYEWQPRMWLRFSIHAARILTCGHGVCIMWQKPFVR